jgi:hypothetical protein
MTMWRTAVAAAAVVLVLSGCVSRRTETVRSEQQRHATNTSTFPVYRPNEVVDVKALDLGPMVAAFRKNDRNDVSANYRGSEVVLATTASLAELSTWLRGLEKSPPQGLQYTHSGSSGDADAMRNTGAAAATFETAKSDRIVMVFVVDPKQLRAKLGPALDLIDKYDKVPGMLRGPIDDQMKQQIGYSVSEMLDANSPVGVAFRGLKTAESRNRRAIVLVDQRKAE